jgi:hypothetical protein
MTAWDVVIASEECLDLVDLSAGNVEGGVVLPYGLRVRALQ